MKKSLRILLLAGIVGLMAFTTACMTPESDAYSPAGRPIDTGPELADTSPTDDDFLYGQGMTIPEFMYFSGTVVEIMSALGPPPVDGQPVWHGLSVLVEGEVDADGYAPRVNFSLTEDTVRLLGGDDLWGNIEIGMTVTGFYDATLPVPLIYPPHFNAVAFARGNAGVRVDRFDENFLSSDGSLFIHIGEDTEIVFQDGTAFEGERDDLVGRALVVLYDIVLDSFPQQTSPVKVIVLFERAEHPAMPDISWEGGFQLSQEDIDAMWDGLFDPETVKVIVEGEAVEMPTPFINREAGFIMVPAAYIAEALGYVVTGEGFDTVIGRYGEPGGIVAFVEGLDAYMIGRIETISLGAAPEVVDGVLFVPLHFFGMVLPEAGFVMDGNIFIEKMIIERQERR